MKPFLIVAGLLMTGASVYGVVDYNKKAKSQEFKELYKEKALPVETEISKEDAPMPVVENKEELKPGTLMKEANDSPKKTTKKKAIKRKKEERVFRIREFSRGKLG